MRIVSKFGKDLNAPLIPDFAKPFLILAANVVSIAISYCKLLSSSSIKFISFHVPAGYIGKLPPFVLIFSEIIHKKVDCCLQLYFTPWVFCSSEKANKHSYCNSRIPARLYLSICDELFLIDSYKHRQFMHFSMSWIHATLG